LPWWAMGETADTSGPAAVSFQEFLDQHLGKKLEWRYTRAKANSWRNLHCCEYQDPVRGDYLFPFEMCLRYEDQSSPFAVLVECVNHENSKKSYFVDVTKLGGTKRRRPPDKRGRESAPSRRSARLEAQKDPDGSKRRRCEEPEDSWDKPTRYIFKVACPANVVALDQVRWWDADFVFRQIKSILSSVPVDPAVSFEKLLFAQPTSAQFYAALYAKIDFIRPHLPPQKSDTEQHVLPVQHSGSMKAWWHVCFLQALHGSLLVPNSRVRVAPSTIEGAGQGLFACVPIARGEMVTFKGGVIADGDTVKQAREGESTHAVVVKPRAYGLVIDGHSMAQVGPKAVDGLGALANESLQRSGQNAQTVWVALPQRPSLVCDIQARISMPMIQARRDIAAGEEIFICYGQKQQWRREAECG